MHLIPNILTLLRIFLLGPIIYSVTLGDYQLALLLFVIAALSDGLDGLLARRFHWTSRFGSIVDPLADKFLLMSCFIILYRLDSLPWWVLTTVIGRDLIIFFGALAYHYLVAPYELVPSQISKINTFLQIILVFMMLIDLAYHIIPALMINAMIGLVMLAAISSGVDYIWTWGTRAFIAKHKLQPARGKSSIP